ncbi:DUF917 domain-containing protein [Gandjariella thermophila]|uniref:DUF917 domain-containing protein n=1 Tax=Gandjariella thermophila TaxID=1931992 RepID=A0A4D4J3A9_9PSEU|nr:DUF917 domain-containing protein [Gandjariella thermophila]GDY28487.1 hypothetical protein GTS_01200 [Gandjariella thermophila]
MPPARLLSLDDVEALHWGANLLGSGGGGPRLGALLVSTALTNGAAARLVTVDALSGGWVLPVAVVGSSASVGAEKLPAGDEWRRAVQVAERHLGATVDAIAVPLIGGATTLYPFLAATQTGKPVVDADLSGRACSRLDQTVVGAELRGTWVFADAHGTAVILHGADARLAERVIRGAVAGLGGWAAVACPPLRAETFRTQALTGSVSQAITLGGRYLAGIAARDDGKALAARLGGHHLGQGTVLEVRRFAGPTFARGSVGIRATDQRRVLRVEMQNEFAMVMCDGEVVATAPDVICLLDVHSRQVIQTGQVRRGHEVDVFVLPVPDRLWQPDVLDRVAPRAYGLETHPVRKGAPSP